MTHSAQNISRISCSALPSNFEDEPDVKVPLIGEKGKESLNAVETEALIEAAEEALQAESNNRIAVGEFPHFSSRHAEPLTS